MSRVELHYDNGRIYIDNKKEIIGQACEISYDKLLEIASKHECTIKFIGANDIAAEALTEIECIARQDVTVSIESSIIIESTGKSMACAMIQGNKGNIKIPLSKINKLIQNDIRIGAQVSYTLTERKGEVCITDKFDENYEGNVIVEDISDKEYFTIDDIIKMEEQGTHVVYLDWDKVEIERL